MDVYGNKATCPEVLAMNTWLQARPVIKILEEPKELLDGDNYKGRKRIINVNILVLTGLVEAADACSLNDSKADSKWGCRECEIGWR